MALSWARIWRIVLTVAFVMVGVVGYAQIDARSLMNAQRNQQRGLDANGMPLDQSQQGADGQQVDENGKPIEGEKADSTKKKRPRKP